MITFRPVPASQNTALPTLLFWGLLAAICIWVFSLPLFPTQDGPMHRYYAHVLGSLLQHQSAYNAYELRRPLPPYLTQYSILLLLYRVFSYDIGDKVFTCLVMICLAVGLRFTLAQAGPRGRWLAPLCIPLLFAWPLMMGFYNFTLGIGLLLVCTGFWQRLTVRGSWALAGFVLTLIVLTLTHPIPLLLLIGFCLLDLVLSFLFRAREEQAGVWFREHRFQTAALIFTLVAAIFPALAVDSSRTGSTLSHFGLFPPFIKTSLLLAGVSPYNTRSHDVWINLYRLALYLLFAGCMASGAIAAVRSLRSRTPNFAATAFFGTLLTTLALPILPSGVNGSAYFTTRLVFVLWLGALVAAASRPEPSASGRRFLATAAILCCLVTLIPAQKFIRPMANELRKAELMPLPGGPGLLLLGDRQQEWVRFSKEIMFDPFQWASALAIVRDNVVVLDSPWMDQKITPIRAVPGGPELVSDVATTHTLKPGDTDASLVPGRSLPGWAEGRMARAAHFILFSGIPAQLAQGLGTQLSPDEAARFQCDPPKDWYVLCTSK